MAAKTEFKEDLKNIKYVVVTANMRRDTTHSLKGLFLGIKPLTENNTVLASAVDMYLWLIRGTHIEVLSLDHWDITNIEVKSGHRERSSHGLSQSIMTARLTEIHEALENDNKVLEGGLIDTSKYYDVPNDLKKSRTTTSSTASTGGSSARNTTTTTTTYKKKEVETLFFSRKTKYSIKQATAKMREKLDQLRGGDYPVDNVKDLLKNLEANESESKKK